MSDHYHRISDQDPCDACPADQPVRVEREAFIFTANKMDFNEAETMLRRVSAYLPRNYDATLSTANNLVFRVKISGYDSAGWTLDGYVIPRLASGNMYAEETDRSKAVER